jgi:hypothetical protein
MSATLSWKDITIKRFTEATGVLETDYPQTDLGQIDREIDFVSALTDISRDEILRMHRTKFTELSAELEFIAHPETISQKWPKWFMLKGQLFKPTRKLNNLTAGQYIDLMSFNKDPLGNLHKILATLCLPCTMYLTAKKYDGKKHAEISEFFYENLTMDIAYPIAVFFCKVWEDFMPHMLTFLETEIQNLNQETKDLMQSLKTPSLNSSDGSTHLTSLPGAMVQNGNTTRI